MQKCQNAKYHLRQLFQAHSQTFTKGVTNLKDKDRVSYRIFSLEWGEGEVSSVHEHALASGMWGHALPGKF